MGVRGERRREECGESGEWSKEKRQERVRERDDKKLRGRKCARDRESDRK